MDQAEPAAALSPDEMVKIIVRQHRVINNLKDHLASVILGLAETQASLAEVREEAAQNNGSGELPANHEPE